MKTLFKIALSICLLSAISAKAQTLGFNFSSFTSANAVVPPTAYGYQFQVTTQVVVTALAVFDKNAPSALANDTQVYLYDDSNPDASDGDYLVTATIPSGTLPIPGTYFCMMPITPVTLNTGNYRISSNGTMAYTNGAVLPGFTNAPGLVYLNSCRYVGGSDAFYPDTLNPSLNPFLINANIVLLPPTPGITSGENQTTLYWPATEGNHIVQTTTNLSNPNWQTVTNGIVIIGITVTNTAPAAFYRLQ
jgi:hypothetical protein